MNIKKSASILFIMMLISKALGILRESVLIYYYGQGFYSDIYLASAQIPNVLFGIVATGLISTFIPIYSRVREERGIKRANKFMNNILTIVFFITLILVIFGLIFTEQIVYVFNLGYSPEKIAAAADFTRVTLFALLANGVLSIFSGYQNYNGRFNVAPVGGFIMNIVVISSFVVSSFTKPIVMVYGLVIAAVLQLLFSVFIAYTAGDFEYKFTIDFKDRYLKPMLIMALPIIFGSSVSQLNGIIDTTIASTLTEGAQTIISSANKISGAIFSLFVASLTTVMYPSIIRQANTKDYDGMKNTLVEIMNLIALIVIPATIGLIALASPVVHLFFGRGAGADPIKLQMTMYALIGGSIGLIGVSINDVLVRAYYSLNDSLTPVKTSVISIVINVILNLLLAPRLGVAGLTLATSISSMVGMSILYVSLNKRMKGLKTRKLLRSMSKITIASLFMGVVSFITYNFIAKFDMHYLIPLAAAVGLGVIVYAILLHVLKVDEFVELINMIKVKLKIGTAK